MAVNQIPKISDLPEPPDRLVGDQERFDVLTFNSLKAQKKMVNEDLNKTLIPALNEFAVDVNASVDAAKASETSALASKNAAASSAATATTKAGEAAASAKAAKTSETSALASKNAASSSATAAANAQKAAKAARDEAQDLANVGYASESHAGLSKVDGKTTQADAGGVITVKDVAIGGNLGDLASARGQIGDAKEMPNLDFNTLTTPGNYRITGNPTNGPSLPLNISGASIGSLIVAGTLGQHGRIFQIMISGSAVTWRTTQNSTGATWGAWQQLLSGNKVGDGIRVTNGTISVPEYEGATASTAGTSGLVPPATAGQQDSFLTGGGEYKPALTKISDSVNLADSKTAASAKAVKAAYDLANSKQPNLGFTPVQQGGGAGQEGQKIYIGWSPSGLKAQADELDLGNVVTTSAGCMKAPSATHADTATEAVYPLNTGKKRMYFDWAAVDGTPTKVWGTTDGQTSRVYNPSNFRVNYANSAGSALVAAPAVQWVVNTSGPAITVPPGGTYDVVCICFNDSGGKGAVKHYPGTAGGTVIPNASTDYFVAGLCARVA